MFRLLLDLLIKNARLRKQVAELKVLEMILRKKNK